MAAFNSPFSVHLHTNYVPYDVEKMQISELLIAPQRKAHTLGAEIGQLKSRIAEVKARRDALDVMITEQTSLLAPWRRIPDKILSAIFIYCLPAQHYTPMTIHDAPLRLTFVCQRWRRVAFNTPYLWATLHIVCVSTWERAAVVFFLRVQSHLNAIVQWINRSGSCPLSISTSDCVRPFFIYLHALRQFSNRWLNIQFNGIDQRALLSLASLSHDDVPMLETMNLRFPSSVDERTSSQWRMQGGLFRGNKLRIVSIYHRPVALDVMALDWSGLTTLILCDASTAVQSPMTPSEAVAILSQCKNLLNLTMSIFDHPPTGPFQLPAHANLQYSLPHLQNLSINDNYFFTSTLFSSIHAPSLTGVAYSTQFWPSRIRRSPLVALLARNGRTVRSLIMDPSFLSHAEFVDCCRLSPFLARLHFLQSSIPMPNERRNGLQGPINQIIMNVVFQLLTPADQGKCHWPYLQYLQKSRSFCGPYLDEKPVFDLIQKRMEGAKKSSNLPLKWVKVSLGCFVTRNIRSLLQEYAEDGLHLQLEDYIDNNFLLEDFESEEAEAYDGMFSPREGIHSLHRKLPFPF
ncbi:hypothetical protein BDN70DRAFT_862273 [Pholiota conissans]|uniref:F-box domain-containing protein n=1 Tax=Pholiota conissans TaxID=109636 RepID=A0A9P5YX79_9AGAR|nr:hypothetical protein BDN70DRAFT_862273 [Pholiota conissans]